ncbi:TIGR00341 family protein [Pseudoxanthomonas dokdonensis]|uniref:OmpA-like domain-containing protein n=1 Tax=Pseudoxanthomonas dokdonensis TaxID=344882 RepID=A0A0R0D257_9GAMM|nr:TIGR00341 family protein [Pseudoxanthomonas dokdonensis]KRG72036.1 hypothetical protein ABB29_00815 [Pseudoxanthomonas dokdonensis]
MASSRALWRWFRQWRRENLQVDRSAVLVHVDEGGRLGPRYAFMVLMSCGIAMLGLLQNSVAVIIGAMLISPLMGPIVELGMSLATFDFRSMRDALRTLLVGICLALLISFLIVLVSPLQDPTPEILARTEPTLFDLLVAIFSGLAGAYATITRKGETIVGVAIATALMPPLAVVGFGIAIGNATIAGGAAFLFMTNLLAIALSVTIMARWYHFGHHDSPKQTVWQAILIIGAFVLLSVPLGLALHDIAERGLAERSIKVALEKAASAGNGQLTTLRVNRTEQRYIVDAVMLTPEHHSQLQPRLQKELSRELGRPVQLELREVLTADDQSIASEKASLALLRESVDRLQVDAQRHAQQRSLDQRASDELRQRALASLGSFEVLQDGQHARWRLRQSAGLDLAAAHRLESAMATTGKGPQIDVEPAQQPLPWITFADDSAVLDARAEAALQDVAWALSRWQLTRVEVTGHAGGQQPLAQARAEAVANWLRQQGLQVDNVDAASREDSRRMIAEQGQAATRVVVISPATP